MPAIPDRLEKLKFIAEEMQIAFFLTSQAKDAFLARTLARHILIRAENFIAHARGLRKPLKKAGCDIETFHKTKEIYATTFDEYFSVSRDRLGAHVQDLDFGRRIELWNDIEIVKISYFVDGAREIYQGLKTLGVPGYTVYQEPSELTDPTLGPLLQQIFLSIEGRRSQVEIGSDSLALTRNRTVGGFNGTPVHARAAQLALIRRWIALQRTLLLPMKKYPRVERVLAARLVTDLVSFCDCLVTRPVPATAPQAMDGLDKLIAAIGHSPAPIDDFVAVSTFHARLGAARAVRDGIGAHVEIESNRTLATLQTDLDSYNWEEGFQFYEKLEAAFAKACRRILFLRMYVVDGQPLYGLSTTAQSPEVPYSGSTTPAPAPDAPMALDDDESYRSALRSWLDGNEAEKGEARFVFLRGFQSSTRVELLTETEHIGSSQRSTHHEFRRAHQFLLHTLADGLSDSDFRGVLQLMIESRSGWPYPLAEVLVRYAHHASVFEQWCICCALGEIGSSPHATVSDYLNTRACSANLAIRLEAILATFKIAIKAEGLFRLNRRGQTKLDFETLVRSLIAPLPQTEAIVCLLAFASALSGPAIGALASPFTKDYVALQVQLESLCVPFLKDDEQKTKARTLKQLLQTHDYVGLCVLLALDLNGDDTVGLGSLLVDNCCNGTIAAAAHDQAARHLAMCFLLKKDHHQAFLIAKRLASLNPDAVDAQFLVADILADLPGAELEAHEEVARIRRSYTLTPASESRLSALQAKLAVRQP